MMMKVACILLVLVAFSGVIASREGRGGRRDKGNRQPRRQAGIPSGATRIAGWQRAVPGSQVKEFSYYKGEESNPSIFIKSKGHKLQQGNYMPSVTLFDFTNGQSVVVMKVKRVKGCVKLNKPTDLSSATIIQEITALDGTVVPSTTPVNLYTTDLPDGESDQLKTRSAVRDLCGRKPILGVTDVAPTPAPEGPGIATTTLGEELLITTSRRGGRGGRRGGGGRRGREGHRRNNSPSV